MNPQVLRGRLPRTWGPFFGRHGNFTSIQRLAIPALLDGESALLQAGTASGKTEAALAPLIERHLAPDREEGRLKLLILLPTRALISDLHHRLEAPLDQLRVSCAVKTRDVNSFHPRRPADVLLTTPESLDSLLASEPKALIHVQAVVIDELHTFIASVRGDQLRVLLARLRHLRTYAAGRGDAGDDAIQFAALSATLAQPEISAARYFPNGRVISTGEQRPIHFDRLPLEDGEPSALFEYLKTFQQRGWKKALVFCNTRAEVEVYAAHTRAGQTPFGGAVYAHYSNLAPERRREIEEQFSLAEAAICFASSTLELGIDIGSLDVVLLIGAPGSAEAFTQRIGRASRRRQSAEAACFYRTPLERALFEALTTLRDGFTPPTPFRPAVAIQQIFSLLKASPSAGLRLNPLSAVFDGLLTTVELESILGELQAAAYLTVGRPGEWRAGPRLNRLIDLQSSERVPLSLYSNLQINADTLKIRDQYSQRVVAEVDRLMFDDNNLLLEGRRLNVEWVDGDALWVSAARDQVKPLRSIYRSARPVLSYELAHALPQQLGLPAGSAPQLETDGGWLWFHWLGDVYGRALLELLRYTLPAEPSDQPGIALLLLDELRQLPRWTVSDVSRYLSDRYRVYEPLLGLGAYHTLLPVTLRRGAVIDQFDVTRFLDAVSRLKVERAPESLTESLVSLVHDQP